jgi:hypothetical protein
MCFDQGQKAGRGLFSAIQLYSGLAAGLRADLPEI